MSFRIAVDIDGVLSNFTKSFCNVINQRYCNLIPPNYQPPDWNYSDKLTPEMMKLCLGDVLKTRNVWLEEEPLVGAQQMRNRIGTLKSAGITVYYVTHRPPTIGYDSLTQTNMWLRSQSLLEANTSTVVVNSSEDKDALYKMLGIKFSIDDRPETVNAVSINIIPHASYLLNQSWNQDERWAHLKRVGSVDQFLSHVMSGYLDLDNVASKALNL